MNITLVPYKGYSKATQLLLAENPSWSYNTKGGDIIINYGSTTKNYSGTLFINHPHNVKKAVNKLTCFQLLAGTVNIPRFTTSVEEASTYNRPVYERHLLCATQGKGIVVNNDQPLGNAKLYVEGLDIKREYRVIVIKDTIVATMMKVPRRAEEQNYDIRNMDNGWRYSNTTPYPNELASVTTEAVKAVKALGLQFGAVDLVVTTEYIPTVLEVNTAFGLGENNVKLFSEALNAYINTIKELL